MRQLWDGFLHHTAGSTDVAAAGGFGACVVRSVVNRRRVCNLKAHQECDDMWSERLYQLKQV